MSALVSILNCTGFRLKCNTAFHGSLYLSRELTAPMKNCWVFPPRSDVTSLTERQTAAKWPVIRNLQHLLPLFILFVYAITSATRLIKRSVLRVFVTHVTLTAFRLIYFYQMLFIWLARKLKFYKLLLARHLYPLVKSEIWFYLQLLWERFVKNANNNSVPALLIALCFKFTVFCQHVEVSN